MHVLRALPAVLPTPASRRNILLLSICLVFLLLQSFRKTLPPLTPAVHSSQPSQTEKTSSASSLPTVLIYRRTKKTASSSVLEALLKATLPLNYTPLYHQPIMMRDVIRAERLKPHPRRLLVAQHNHVTKADTHPLRAVIADSIVDGYKQITAFCRYVRDVPDCRDAMHDCLSTRARAEKRYRWAGREWEDDDTFIDLPLSAAHPAMSTTVLRHVFPDVTLNIASRNVKGSACPDVPRLREAYRNNFMELDKQIDMLRIRMLAMAGYPVTVDSSFNVTTANLLDAAEQREARKYRFEALDRESTRGLSGLHRDLVSNEQKWKLSEDGQLFLNSELRKRATDTAGKHRLES